LKYYTPEKIIGFPKGHRPRNVPLQLIVKFHMVRKEARVNYYEMEKAFPAMVNKYWDENNGDISTDVSTDPESDDSDCETDSETDSDSFSETDSEGIYESDNETK
jgi:hypothetical protein